MQKGLLPQAPIWPDVRTLPTELWAYVDIITGGFPCQDISVAGNGKGLEGGRSKLFFSMLGWIKRFNPPWVFIENVPAIRTRGAERVCKELAKIGYDCRWTTLSAQEIGAPHKRNRWWLLAYSPGERWCPWSNEDFRYKGQAPITKISDYLCEEASENSWETKSPICGMDDGVPNWVDRIRAIGNSVVPKQTRKAFTKLLEEI